MTRFRFSLITLVSLLALACAPSAQAVAWQDLNQQILRPWVGYQSPDGNFWDPLLGKNTPRYAQAMLGYGMLDSGIRQNDPAQVEAGVRSLNFIASQPEVLTELPSVFEIAAMASAYNRAAQGEQQHTSLVAARQHWASWLAQVRPVFIGVSTGYGNKHLVEAVGWAELLRSELRSDLRGSVLYNRSLARTRLNQLLNQRIPGLRRENTRVSQGQALTLLSDPPRNPLAYHALSAGMYARALVRSPSPPSSMAKRTLLQMVDASLWVTAPDGDTAYTGRSQEQAWALSLGAYAAGWAAKQRPSHAARYRQLSESMLGRLAEVHGVGTQGLHIVPLQRAYPQHLARGADDYATAAVYNGLTAASVAWAQQALEGSDRARARATTSAAGSTPSSARKTQVALVGTRESAMVTVRSSRMWFAARTRADTHHGLQDLRSDFGLVAAKRLNSSGRWEDILAHRPMTHTAQADGAGPLLLSGSQTGTPIGVKMKALPDGVEMTGGFQDGQGRWLRRNVRFRFQALGDKVRLTMPVRAGDRYQVSEFIAPPASARMSVSGSGNFKRQALADAETYFSAMSPLSRQRQVLTARRSGVLTLEWR